ncbi:MAG: rRNA pseudouridine synthase [Chloroflexi bacterium]|nr:rRNA pseudouridine synthase [Chloroflexota bacterium]
MAERLQKIMAHVGIASRRECEKIIKDGRVKVNGRVASLGDKADLTKDRIEVNGRLLPTTQIEYIYVALNKPKGVLSSLSDELERGRKTVRDLIPLPGHLYPVGRLDKQSMGLMLMTNNGDLAHKLTHPRYGHEKTYHVTVDGRISLDTIKRWENGVYLDGQKTAPAKIKILRQEVRFTLLEIVMREGRKRQIRRIASMMGHPVTRLLRVKIDSVDLGTLKPGDWRHLTKREVERLQKTVNRKGKFRRRRPKSSKGKRYGRKR